MQMQTRQFLGSNLFTYCENNPIIRADHSGESWAVAFLIVGALAILSGCSAGKSKDTVGAASSYRNVKGGKRETTPNCYAYAIGKYDKSYNPGDFSTPNLKFDIDSVAAAVLSDLKALSRSARIINGYNGAISENEYRIALRVKSKAEVVYTPGGYYLDWDYHFMVQTSTGQWAEKHGPGGDSILHDLGQTPDTISWDLNDQIGYYDSKIVYFAISN